MAHLKKRGKKYYAWYYLDGKQKCVNLDTTDCREALRKKRVLEASIVLETKLIAEERTRKAEEEARKAEEQSDEQARRAKEDRHSFPKMYEGVSITDFESINLQINKLPKNCLLDDLWDMYTAWAKWNKRPNTLATQGYAWRKLLEFTSAKRVDDLTQDILEQFKIKCLQAKLTPTSVNIYLKSLQGIFTFAIQNGLYTGKNPITQVKMFRVEKNAPQFLSSKQITKVLSLAKEKDASTYLVFALGIYAGLRKNEIANARWEWFNFNSNLINVRSSTGFHLKDYESRCIPLSIALIQCLEPYKKDTGYLFEAGASNKGKGRYRFEPKRAFAVVAKDAGVPWCTIQTLRETFASQLVSAGVSIYKVSKWLGHSDVKTTQVHYAHLLAAHDTDIDRPSVDRPRSA